jgi:hypothetical protein
MNKIVKYERLIQGDLLKCVDGRWNPPPPLELLVVGLTRALQCWSEGFPVDTIIERPGEPLPDLEELNAQIPENEWEPGLDGKPRAPWQLNFVVYLVNVETADTYTFANSTTGAKIAWERLETKFAMMRRLRGHNVCPLVKLENRPMKIAALNITKLRPEFTILEWRDLGPPPTDKDPISAGAAAPAEKKKTTVGKPVKPITQQEELDDEIPFIVMLAPILYLLASGGFSI